MRYVKPYYYDEFRCVADQCPDTCCAGWQIVIDEKTLERYEGEVVNTTDGVNRTDGVNCADDVNHTADAGRRAAFASRLYNSVDWQDGCFKQYHGRCSMLNEENLCDLVIEKGEAWLCDTCNRYPRHIEEFDGVRELSLSLSCPVAAKMMLQREEPVRFLIEENEEDDPLEEEFEEFDFLLFTQLEDARGVLFSIVQNRKTAIEYRMALIMQMAEEMQHCLDENRLFDMEAVVEKYAKSEEKVTCYVPDGEERYRYLKENFVLFHKLERLRKEWTGVITETEKLLYQGSYEQYSLIYNEFKSEFVTETGEKRWEIFLEQILMFFLYTYFCGAVYDDCIYSKVAMAVFSARYIQEFIMCRWYLQEKKLDVKECTEIAYRYAREVEHSDENLNLLEEWMYKDFG